MTGQHEPLWKPEVKSGAPEGLAFPACMRHPSWRPLCRIMEWKILMTTKPWHTDSISHGGGHWDIRKFQIMVTTKTFLSVYLSLVSMKPWLRSFLVNRTDRCRKY